jgi:hypothetical protein
MLAFRSVVSVLLRALGDFSLHPSRPALRAAASGGRPRAGSHPTATRGTGLTLRTRPAMADTREGGCLMRQYADQGRRPVHRNVDPMR